MSELLNKDVTWTAKTKTAEINDKNVNDEKTKKENPITTITMDNGDIIELELYPEIAPITVENFCTLINQGFYDGLNFHRVIPGFMVQGGDPNADGTGGSENLIKGEFIKNGVKNNISHTRGTLSMARAMDPNSGSSQFFIVVEDSLHLDGEYAAFGKVTQGMDIVDQIVSSEIGQMDKPLTPQIIKKITVK